MPAADAVKEYSLHVGKILTETPWFLETRGEFTLLYPQCVQDAVVQDTEPRTYHYLVASDDHRESYAAIRQIMVSNCPRPLRGFAMLSHCLLHSRAASRLAGRTFPVRQDSC